MNTRQGDVLIPLDGAVFCREGPLDLTRLQQLPTHQYVYNRYLTLCQEKPLRLPGKSKIVIQELAKELRSIWIYMNIPPMTRVGVVAKLEKIMKAFEQHKKVHPPKRNKKWQSSHKSLLDTLENGFDIKAVKTDVIQQCIDTYDVVPGDEEERMYVDNCVPNTETGKCERKVWNGSTDTVWLKKANIRRSKLQRSEELRLRREEKCNEDKRKLKLIKEVAQQSTSNDLDVPDQHEDEELHFLRTEEGEIFNPPKKPRMTMFPDQEKSSRATRSQNEHIASNIAPLESHSFPKIRVRTGYQTFNLDVIEALVVMESKFKVDGRQAPSLLAYIANTVFKQDWIVLSEKETKKEEDEKPEYYDYVLPHRSTVASKVEDFALLSFLDMAESIENAKSKNQVVTYGTDDTTKAAGHKKFDMKTTHITLIDEDRKRETFTSGFYENVSHKGVDSASTVRHDIAKMAILTDNTYDDMLQLMDFFMTDRAGDADTMLDELDIDDEKRLKCNAHVLLAIDNALDKVFKDTETLIGVFKLISETAAHVFNAPKSSIWYLGLIAFAKLLSPSHNKESISLYTDYTKFLRDDSQSSSDTSSLSKTLLKNGFKGFQSNRFGRIGQLSATTVEHAPLVRKFFDEMVNEHANKLVLAVHAYLQSEWFLLCCNIGKKFNEKVILPIKEMLKIDEYKHASGPERSWEYMKTEFNEILQKLEAFNSSNESSAENKLEKQCAISVRDAIKNQLDGMQFYKVDNINEEVVAKMRQAPGTNLGSEGEFAHGDNDLRRCGGSTSLKTVSDKHVIKRNALYTKEKWTLLSEQQKRRKWRWAAGSPEAKKVKALEAEFRARIRSVQQLAFEGKARAKAKINMKLMENLEACKKHGGPVTAEDIHKLDSLSYEELVSEVGHLKKTIAPQLRFKRKVEKKMIDFDGEELS